jgi:hypothetical protein
LNMNQYTNAMGPDRRTHVNSVATIIHL